MPVLVLNKDWASKLLTEREQVAESRWDEVWDGVTIIMPEADIEHDDIDVFFIFVFKTVFARESGVRVHGRVNVSDRVRGWMKNYRIPDMSIFQPGNSVVDCRTHYRGGPDLAMEIVSPDDRSRDKLNFYAKVGTREVLIVDRYPWQLELYRREDDEMKLVGRTKPGDRRKLMSAVVPLGFQLLRGRPRPKVKIIHTETGQEWVG
jgi:Uma2 family endonuclease